MSKYIYKGVNTSRYQLLFRTSCFSLKIFHSVYKRKGWGEMTKRKERGQGWGRRGLSNIHRQYCKHNLSVMPSNPSLKTSLEFVREIPTFSSLYKYWRNQYFSTSGNLIVRSWNSSHHSTGMKKSERIERGVLKPSPIVSKMFSMTRTPSKISNKQPKYYIDPESIDRIGKNH